MQLCNTKDNHYVPQFYLKSFIGPDKFVYYYDKITNKFLKTKNTETIGFKTNLYTITQKITNTDINVFATLFGLKLNSPLEKMFLLYLTALLNDEFKKLFTVTYSKNKQIEQEINFKLENLLNSPDISRNQELLFGFYENKFIPIYEDILQSETLENIKRNEKHPVSYLVFQTMGFILKTMWSKLKLISKKYTEVNIFSQPKLKDTIVRDYYIDCVQYLVIQYFRTSKRIRNSLLEKIGKKVHEKTKGQVSMDNIMYLLVHFQTLNLIDKLISGKYKLILLKNTTRIPFITSDNPAVNPYTGIIYQDTIPDGYEIFLPLSPKLALLYTNCCLYKTVDFVATLNERVQVDYWNKLIFDEAERFIYTHSEIFQKDICSKYAQMSKFL